MRAFAALSLIALAACAPAAADEGAAPDSVIKVGCRQGECAWLRPAGIETVETTGRGALKRLVARRGTSVHLDGSIPERAPEDVEWERADGTYYAFCSKERPAYAFPGSSGGLTVHFLDLFDLAGYQMSSAGMYLRLCHGLDRLPEDEKVLSGLGYRPGTRDEQVEAATPETMTRF